MNIIDSFYLPTAISIKNKHSIKSATKSFFGVRNKVTYWMHKRVMLFDLNQFENVERKESKMNWALKFDREY